MRCHHLRSKNLSKWHLQSQSLGLLGSRSKSLLRLEIYNSPSRNRCWRKKNEKKGKVRAGRRTQIWDLEIWKNLHFPIAKLDAEAKKWKFAQGAKVKFQIIALTKFRNTPRAKSQTSNMLTLALVNCRFYRLREVNI